jgi:transcriptional regulator
MPATVKIHWTEAEDAHLLNLRAQGYTNQQIADSVGRP